MGVKLRGFSLVEVILSLLIFSLLSSGAFTMYSRIINHFKRTEFKRTCLSAAEDYLHHDFRCRTFAPEKWRQAMEERYEGITVTIDNNESRDVLLFRSSDEAGKFRYSFSVLRLTNETAP